MDATGSSLALSSSWNLLESSVDDSYVASSHVMIAISMKRDMERKLGFSSMIVRKAVLVIYISSASMYTINGRQTERILSGTTYCRVEQDIISIRAFIS